MIGSHYMILSENALEDSNGYQYLYHRSNVNGDRLWRCRKRGQKTVMCKAGIRTRDESIIEQLNQHNHSPIYFPLFNQNKWLKKTKNAKLIQIFLSVSELFSRFDHFIQIPSSGKQGNVIEDESGYRFHFCRPKKNGITLWRCTKASSKFCKTYVDTQDGLIIRQKRRHTHTP